MRILFLLFLVLGVACAGGIVKPRSFSKRTFRFCSAKETPIPEAKLCYRRCIKRRLLGKCKEWRLDISDLTDPLIHSKFLAADFQVKVD